MVDIVDYEIPEIIDSAPLTLVERGRSILVKCIQCVTNTCSGITAPSTFTLTAARYA